MKDLDQRIREQATRQLNADADRLTEQFVAQLREAAGLTAESREWKLHPDTYFRRGAKVEGELTISMRRHVLLRQFVAAWLADHEPAVGDAAVKSFIGKVERLAEEVDEIRHLSGV